MNRPIPATYDTTHLFVALLFAGLAAACSPTPESTLDTAETTNATPTDTADGSETAGADGGDSSPSLVAIDAWQRVDADSDPLASHRPSSVDCPESAVEREQLQGQQTLSISTERCNYYAVRQQTPVAIDSGDTLRIRVWHFELTHDESASAHVALALDGGVAWEKSIRLPTDKGALLSGKWQADRDYPAGTRVDFHLHNHGSNTWNFIEFSKIEK
ncbi:MAG: hypothetical protein ABEN55_04870 [Bradymonadaceae bacterium]